MIFRLMTPRSFRIGTPRRPPRKPTLPRPTKLPRKKRPPVMPKTKRSGKVFWAVACAAVFAVAVNAADVIIHLRNGDRVTGKISGETATEVTLQSATLGKITVPVGQILKREEVLAASTTNAAPSMTATNIAAAKP